jgi:hypothetical protein
MSSVEIESNIPALLGDVKNEIGKAILKLAFDLKKDIKEQMGEPKSGRIYKRGEDGTHQASAPGEAPAVDSSHYINSIQTTPTEDGAEVATNAVQAPRLEFGDGHVAKRPAWTPAAERTEKKIPGEVAEAVERAASRNEVR